MRYLKAILVFKLFLFCLFFTACKESYDNYLAVDCINYQERMGKVRIERRDALLNKYLGISGNHIHSVEAHKAGDVVTVYDEVYPCNNGEKIVSKSSLIYQDSVRFNRFTTGKILSLDDNSKEYVRYTFESMETPDGVYNYVKVNGKKYGVGQIVRVFDEYDFSEGDWDLFIVAPWARMRAKHFLREMLEYKSDAPEFSDEMDMITYNLFSVNLQRFCVSTSDKELLNELKNIFVFSIDGGYMTTAYLEVYLVHNGRRVFHSDLFLDESTTGINHFFFGYMKALHPDKIREFIKKLKPVDFSEAEKYFLE